MKLNSIAKNQTELTGKDKIIFFSYNTPVVAFINGVWCKTSKKFSATTTRHINQYLAGQPAELKNQEFFNSLS